MGCQASSPPAHGRRTQYGATTRVLISRIELNGRNWATNGPTAGGPAAFGSREIGAASGVSLSERVDWPSAGTGDPYRRPTVHARATRSTRSQPPINS